MGTKTVPERTVRTCDVCGREKEWLYQCAACGRDYCPASCEGIFAGCGVAPRVCQLCPRTEQVTALCDEYAERLSAIVSERDAKIAALRGPTPTDTPET